MHELRSITAFPHEPRVRIGRRGVSIVGALLALEVGLLVLAPGAGGGRVLFVLALETLLTGPSFDERAVHREVLAGEDLSLLGLLQDLLEELPGDLLLQKPLPILRKGGRMPDLVIHAQADEPPEEQVVIELLDQHPLASDAVEHLDQKCP